MFNVNSNIFEIEYNFYDEVGYSNDNSMYFCYNNSPITFDFHSILTKIGDFFKNNEKPEVMVKDPNNLKGHKIQVTFKTNHGYIHKMYFNSRKKIVDILKAYLEEICEIFIIERMGSLEQFNIFPNKVQFLYKGQEIKVYYGYHKNEFYDNIIDIYFKNDNNPTIFVNDPNNLFLINWFEKKHIIFQTNLGYKNELVANNYDSCFETIEKYFKTIGHKFIYKKYKIKFIYKGQEMKYE